MNATKTRSIGTELSDFSVSTFTQDAKTKGYEMKGSAYITMRDNYKPDRSKRRLERNMTWMVDFIRAETPNINTRAARVYEMRLLLHKMYPVEYHNMITATMVLSKEEYNTKAKKSNISLTAALKSVFTISLADIKTAVDTLKTATDLYSTIALVQLATGRRLIGVLEACDRPVKKGKNIVFTRLAKSDSKEERKVPLYFLTYKELTTKWDRIRQEVVVCDTRAKTSTMYNALVTSKVRALFGDDKSTHFLRKVYVAYGLQFKPKRWNDITYINKILAHDKTNLTSALNYSNVVIGAKTNLTKQDNAINPTVTKLTEAVKKLRAARMPTTVRNLKAEGFGSKTIARYLKGIIATLDA
jgi:hypothetical protein